MPVEMYIESTFLASSGKRERDLLKPYHCPCLCTAVSAEQTLFASNGIHRRFLVLISLLHGQGKIRNWHELYRMELRDLEHQHRLHSYTQTDIWTVIYDAKQASPVIMLL